MKILYIGGFELPDKNAAAQRVVANAKLLRELGHEVVLMGVDKSRAGTGGGVKKYGEDFWGFPSYGVAYPGTFLRWIRFVTSVRSEIDFIRENKIDCVVAYNFPALALWRLWRWCRRRGVCVVSDCTEWYIPSGNFLRKFIKAADIDFRMKFVHQRLDGLIAISRYLYDYYKPKMRNVLLLPPLVDKADGKWRASSGVRERELSFVYAGSPGGTKDRLDWTITLLSGIIKENKIPFRFTVLGITEEEYLKTAALPENIRGSVSFLGRVSHKEALSVVASSDYQIFFRERNLANMAGFPTKFVESISCGTPVITNDFSNIADYMKGGKNGWLLDLNDSEKNRTVMNELLVSGKIKKPEVQDDIFDYRHYRDSVRDFFGAL